MSTSDGNHWEGRNVLVTGCTGFLGWWLTKALLDRGAHVVGLVRDVVPRAPFFASGTDQRVTSVRGSLEDGTTVERALLEYEVDTVFHLAAQAIVGAANKGPLPTFEANIRGTWLLLEACRRVPGIEAVVVASSDKAYGDHEVLPYDETHALQGRHPYDVSKSCADLITTSYHVTYGMPVAITRCGNLFGGGDLNWSRIVPGTIRSALKGERPIIRSDGSPLRDYVHVEDAAAAYMALAERLPGEQVAGRGFNLGTGTPVSVLELTQRILAAADRGDLTPDVRNEAVGEIKHQYLSSSLAREVLDWTPSMDLDGRLRQSVAWYRDHLADELGG
jgi:CDP-glucose 4,6-dehydratase